MIASGKTERCKIGNSGKIPLIIGLIIQNPVGPRLKLFHIFSISYEVTTTIKNRYDWYLAVIQSIAPRTSNKMRRNWEYIWF
jgi:hypothetical protein